jgi:Fe-S cluster biogenesis protein NfuA
MSEDLKERVEKSLDTIRPALMADGGNVELVDVEDGIVKVRLQGACGTCPSALMTLKQGIAVRVKEDCPEIQEAEAVYHIFLTFKRLGVVNNEFGTRTRTSLGVQQDKGYRSKRGKRS